MADQYTWEKAKQAGYKVDIVPITRKTIADGNLLNSSFIETFSSKDTYINDNLKAETASANSVYSTVNANSAKNWDNSTLSGFSAFKADSTKVVPSKLNDELKLVTENIATTIDHSTNTVTFGFPDYFKDSYFQRTQRTITPKMQDFPYPFGQRRVSSRHDYDSPMIFGEGLTDTIEGYRLSTRSLLINTEKVVSHSTLYKDGCININPGSTLYSRGILINEGRNEDHDNEGCGIAINNAGQHFIEQIAINNSTSDNTNNKPCFVMNNSTTTGNGAFAFTNIESNYNSPMTLSLFKSSATTGVCVTMHNSKATGGLSFATYNSYSENNGFALYNSSGTNSVSYAVFDSSARSQSIAAFNSSADGFGISMYNSNKYNGEKSCALYNSTATYGAAVALYDSNANNGDTLAMYNSYATNAGDSTTIFNSSAKNCGLVMYDSVITNGQSYSFYNSTADHSQAFAMYNSKAKNSPDIVLYNSISEGDASVQSMLLYDCYYANTAYRFPHNHALTTKPTPANLMYNSTAKPIGDVLVYTYQGCASVTSEVENYIFPLHGIAKYNSVIAGYNAIAEYNSSAYIGTSATITMYNSFVSSTNAQIPRNGTFADYACHDVIAMYDSSVVDETNKMKLWNNNVTIEPSGYVNKVRVIDTSRAGMSTSELDALAQLHTIQAFTDYVEIIIG